YPLHLENNLFSLSLHIWYHSHLETFTYMRIYWKFRVCMCVYIYIFVCGTLYILGESEGVISFCLCLLCANVYFLVQVRKGYTSPKQTVSQDIRELTGRSICKSSGLKM
uniref:Uncharacterized protein n=1 Tax=Zonotrichia albicollis TaxID=44394 RepID=A0A8D2NKH3_ZONAL